MRRGATLNFMEFPKGNVSGYPSKDHSGITVRHAGKCNTLQAEFLIDFGEEPALQGLITLKNSKIERR